jgi:hypothetical protein
MLSRRSIRRLALPFGVVIGLLVGALWFTPAADARSKCHTQWCQHTFTLKGHQRQIFKPKATIQPDESVYMQVQMHGKLVAYRPLGSCAVEFNAYGAAVAADACIWPHHLTFILTNTQAKRIRVTVRYEFLSSEIVG